jgi:hypothetical protein
VQEQIRIAAGEKLRCASATCSSAATIECRINAEDPFKFTPSPGRITSWHTPGGPGVRVDSHAYNGYFVPPNYDSMIGKLITYGATRDQAIRRMRIALSEMVVEGIQTNIPLHRELMRCEVRRRRHQHPLPRTPARAEAAGRTGRSVSMSYRELVVELAREHAEALSDALLDLGALSVSVEDADADTPEQPLFGEPGLVPERTAWQHSRVVALLSPDLEPAVLLAAAANEIGIADTPKFDVREVEEQDWVRLTQSQFEPIPIGERIWVVPSWHDAPDPDALILELDPGLPSAPAATRPRACAWNGSSRR